MYLFLLPLNEFKSDRLLAQITVPTLVLWGDSDRAYLWDQQEQLWRTIPGAQLAVIPGCAHAVHLEKPHLFNAMLEDFLCNLMAKAFLIRKK